MEIHSTNSYNRPVTQARFTVDQSKPLPENNSLLRESFHDQAEWDSSLSRPLTINSTAGIHNNRILMSNYQPVCYGLQKAPIKITGKCIRPTQKMTAQNNAYGGITSELFFPSSTSMNRKKPPPPTVKEINAIPLNPAGLYNGDCAAVPIQVPTGSIWQKIHRRVTTSECGRNFKTHPKSLLPVLNGVIKEKPENIFESRPCTGILPAKIAEEAKLEQKPKKLNVAGASKRIGTAQSSKRSKFIETQDQKPVRLSTPQTVTEKRPESRYNKETLYSKLEHGRASSPEYIVPIIDMRFSEVVGQQIIPECWK